MVGVVQSITPWQFLLLLREKQASHLRPIIWEGVCNLHQIGSKFYQSIPFCLWKYWPFFYLLPYCAFSFSLLPQDEKLLSIPTSVWDSYQNDRPCIWRRCTGMFEDCKETPSYESDLPFPELFPWEKYRLRSLGVRRRRTEILVKKVDRQSSILNVLFSSYVQSNTTLVEKFRNKAFYHVPHDEHMGVHLIVFYPSLTFPIRFAQPWVISFVNRILRMFGDGSFAVGNLEEMLFCRCRCYLCSLAPAYFLPAQKEHGIRNVGIRKNGFLDSQLAKSSAVALSRSMMSRWRLKPFSFRKARYKLMAKIPTTKRLLSNVILIDSCHSRDNLLFKSRVHTRTTNQ